MNQGRCPVPCCSPVAGIVTHLDIVFIHTLIKLALESAIVSIFGITDNSSCPEVEREGNPNCYKIIIIFYPSTLSVLLPILPHSFKPAVAIFFHLKS
jgi:hypothetical protein